MVPGLRQKQKAERRRRLLEAAAACFRAEGYERTRVEAIAASAELSPGTLYNHYRHKGELLMAVAALALEESLAEGESLAADPPAGVEAALNALVEGHLDRSMLYLSKDNWRHATAHALTRPDAAFARRHRELEARLADQVRRLLDALQQRGALRAEVDTIAFARLIFNNAQMLFQEHVRDHAQRLDLLKAGLRAQHAALCRRMV